MYVSPCMHIMHVCLYAYIGQPAHTLKTVPREELNNTLLIYHTIPPPPPHPFYLNKITDLSEINTNSWY